MQTAKQSFPPDFVYLLHAAANPQTMTDMSARDVGEQKKERADMEDEAGEPDFDDAD